MLINEITQPGSKKWLRGNCHAYTIALHNLTGYKPYLIYDPESGILHSAVKHPDGNFVDARGKRTLEDIGKDFHVKNPVAQETKLEGLYFLADPSSRLIAKAAEHAKSNLSWDNIKENNENRPSIKKAKINEQFITEYDMFGWISPNGSLITPRKEDAKSRPYVTHTELIPSIGSYEGAFREGYVRWLIKYDKLYLESNQPISQDMLENIKKGVPQIEKLASEPKNFNFYPGVNAYRQAKANQPLHILYYRLEAKDFAHTADSLKDLLAVASRRTVAKRRDYDEDEYMEVGFR